MSALPQALPLALSAAFYPPALLVLLLLLSGQEPRRLVLAYYGGATVLTIGAGPIALAVLKEGGITTQSSQTASGSIYILFGLLLALAARALRRRVHEPEEIREGDSAASGRLAKWSRRATTSPKWALALGLAMFLPSPLYLLAVKDIADSGDPTSSDALRCHRLRGWRDGVRRGPPRGDVHKARWRRCRTQPRQRGNEPRPEMAQAQPLEPDSRTGPRRRELRHREWHRRTHLNRNHERNEGTDVYVAVTSHSELAQTAVDDDEAGLAVDGR